MNIQVSILAQTPIRRSKLHELVASKLEDMMLSGELKPGDRLPSERDIMSAFNIGRPAVREAFLALQGKGLILTENGRRASVCSPNLRSVLMRLDSVVGIIINDTQNLKNLFEARAFIEAAMARNAARLIDDVRLAELKDALEANRAAIGNRELFMQTDVQFHRVLFLVSDNPVFEAVHKALVNWLMDRWSKIKRDRSTETLAYKGHLHIFQAISRHDPDGAEEAMRGHLTASWAIWTRQLQGRKSKLRQ